VHGASCQRQLSQGLQPKIPCEIVILALQVRPSSAAKSKGARSGRRFAYAYFQNSNSEGVIVPCFQSLFLDCFVQLTKNLMF
jgi:hypothetical protein